MENEHGASQPADALSHLPYLTAPPPTHTHTWSTPRLEHVKRRGPACVPRQLRCENCLLGVPPTTKQGGGSTWTRLRLSACKVVSPIMATRRGVMQTMSSALLAFEPPRPPPPLPVPPKTSAQSIINRYPRLPSLPTPAPTIAHIHPRTLHTPSPDLSFSLILSVFGKPALSAFRRCLASPQRQPHFPPRVACPLPLAASGDSAVESVHWPALSVASPAAPQATSLLPALHQAALLLQGSAARAFRPSAKQRCPKCVDA